MISPSMTDPDGNHKMPPSNSSDKLQDMQEEILRLEAEKKNLENELKSREELMTSLFAYIQTTGKPKSE